MVNLGIRETFLRTHGTLLQSRVDAKATNTTRIFSVLPFFSNLCTFAALRETSFYAFKNCPQRREDAKVGNLKYIVLFILFKGIAGKNKWCPERNTGALGEISGALGRISGALREIMAPWEESGQPWEQSGQPCEQ